MSEHTPGPWIVDGTTLRPYSKLRVYDQDGFMVADCDGQHLDNVAEANARLIAAAPDMAAELERVRAVNAQLASACVITKEKLETIEPGEANDAVDRLIDESVALLDAAIEAAEGES